MFVLCARYVSFTLRHVLQQSPLLLRMLSITQRTFPMYPFLFGFGEIDTFYHKSSDLFLLVFVILLPSDARKQKSFHSIIYSCWNIFNGSIEARNKRAHKCDTVKNFNSIKLNVWMSCLNLAKIAFLTIWLSIHNARMTLNF